MSERYLRKCVGKTRFETRDAADKARRALAAAGRMRMDQGNTYRCSQCGTYHVGHKVRGQGFGKGRRRG